MPHAINPIYVRRPTLSSPVTADQLRMTGSAALTVERLTQPDAEDFNAIVALEGESFSNPWTAVALADMLTSVTRGSTWRVSPTGASSGSARAG